MKKDAEMKKDVTEEVTSTEGTDQGQPTKDGDTDDNVGGDDNKEELSKILKRLECLEKDNKSKDSVISKYQQQLKEAEELKKMSLSEKERLELAEKELAEERKIRAAYENERLTAEAFENSGLSYSKWKKLFEAESPAEKALILSEEIKNIRNELSETIRKEINEKAASGGKPNKNDNNNISLKDPYLEEAKKLKGLQ